MAETTLSDQEIRTDFAQRLTRRFEAMKAAAKCSCGAVGSEHFPSCAVHCWEMATRTIQIVLDEQEEEEDSEAVEE